MQSFPFVLDIVTYKFFRFSCLSDLYPMLREESSKCDAGIPHY